jgi:ionotropic glutamate receptor
VAALTINFQREQVIDFTKPFLNLGISILYKRPAKKKPNLFSFFSPLSFSVWLYMCAAYLGKTAINRHALIE